MINLYAIVDRDSGAFHSIHLDSHEAIEAFNRTPANAIGTSPLIVQIPISAAREILRDLDAATKDDLANRQHAFEVDWSL